MKNNLFYLLSVIILISSIFLIVKYPESGQFNLIAGGLVLTGFSINLVSFLNRKRILVKSENGI